MTKKNCEISSCLVEPSYFSFQCQPLAKEMKKTKSFPSFFSRIVHIFCAAGAMATLRLLPSFHSLHAISTTFKKRERGALFLIHHSGSKIENIFFFQWGFDVCFSCQTMGILLHAYEPVWKENLLEEIHSLMFIKIKTWINKNLNYSRHCGYYSTKYFISSSQRLKMKINCR